jgi:hypothetical protein
MPSLERLTRRLSETPSEFLETPGPDVGAVVSDLLRDLGGSLLTSETARPLWKLDGRTHRLILIASWLLHDESFRAEKRFADAAFRFLTTGLGEIATLVDPALFVSDPDRREELVRRALAALDVVPEGESSLQAKDRLGTLDTIERSRLLRDTRAAQARIREIQEAMRRKAAEEAAAAYGRE